MDVYTRKYTHPSPGSRPGLGMDTYSVGSNISGYYRWWTIGLRITSWQFQDLDEEAGRCGVVHGEKGQSGTIPYTISEKSDHSYGVGRRRADGGLIVVPNDFFPTPRIIISSPLLLFLYSL